NIDKMLVAAFPNERFSNPRTIGLIGGDLSAQRPYQVKFRGVCNPDGDKFTRPQSCHLTENDFIVDVRRIVLRSAKRSVGFHPVYQNTFHLTNTCLVMSQ